MSVVADFAKLLVEVVLQEVDVVDFVGMGGDEFADTFFVVDSHVAPALHFGCVVDVAQSAESGVGGQPRLVLFDKRLEIGRFHCLGAFLGKKLAGIGVLDIVDSFVVDLRQRVEAPALGGVICAAFGVGENSHLLKAQEHRMEGERRVGVIGVGVGPRVGHRGVVDGQNLNEALSGRGGPVDHCLEVDEVADSEVLFAA